MVAEVDLSAANLEGLVHRVCELVHTRTNFFKAYAPNAPMLMLMTATPGSGGLVYSEFERPRDYEPPASEGIPGHIKCGKRSHAILNRRSLSCPGALLASSLRESAGEGQRLQVQGGRNRGASSSLLTGSQA